MEILYFYLSSCPYCRKADKIIAKLLADKPEYRDVKVTKIEERDNAALADRFDYFYVPCLYVTSGGTDPAEAVKMHEGDPSEEAVARVFEYAFNHAAVK